MKEFVCVIISLVILTALMPVATKAAAAALSPPLPTMPVATPSR